MVEMEEGRGRGVCAYVRWVMGGKPCTFLTHLSLSNSTRSPSRSLLYSSSKTWTLLDWNSAAATTLN